MDNIYTYEQMTIERERDVRANLHSRQLQSLARYEDDNARHTHKAPGELIQARRILRLGRLVIMW